MIKHIARSFGKQEAEPVKVERESPGDIILQDELGGISRHESVAERHLACQALMP